MALTNPKISATPISVPMPVAVVPAATSMPGTISVATHSATAITTTRATKATISPPPPA